MNYTGITNLTGNYVVNASLVINNPDSGFHFALVSGNGPVIHTGVYFYGRSGYVFDNSDCNDSNAAVNPAAQEICNGIDDDCDGDTDDDDVSKEFFSRMFDWYVQGRSKPSASARN